jgi:hypothetical protein
MRKQLWALAAMAAVALVAAPLIIKELPTLRRYLRIRAM